MISLISSQLLQRIKPFSKVVQLFVVCAGHFFRPQRLPQRKLPGRLGFGRVGVDGRHRVLCHGGGEFVPSVAAIRVVQVAKRDPVGARNLHQIQRNQLPRGRLNRKAFGDSFRDHAAGVFHGVDGEVLAELHHQHVADLLQLPDLGAWSCVNDGANSLFQPNVAFPVSVSINGPSVLSINMATYLASNSPIRANSSSQYNSMISISSMFMSSRMMFSTRIRALSSLPCSSSSAIDRRCCLASALCFC